MGDIIAELFPLNFSLSEIAKAAFRAAEQEYLGVGFLLINSEKDLHKFQADEKENLIKKELRPSTRIIAGYPVVFSTVMPPGKFTMIFVEGGLVPAEEIEIEEPKE